MQVRQDRFRQRRQRDAVHLDHSGRLSGRNIAFPPDLSEAGSVHKNADLRAFLFKGEDDAVDHFLFPEIARKNTDPAREFLREFVQFVLSACSDPDLVQ